MRTRTLLLPLLVVACGGPPAVDADLAAIQALIDRATYVNNAGDIEGWVSLFADDAVYLPEGRPPVTTRDGLEGVAVSQFSRYRPNIQITTDEIQVLGDWAFARTTVTGTLTPPRNANPIRVDGKELALYRRQPDGSWKIARLIANSSR
jgi:uncharacterized protein (TIGR02246 family)